MCGGVRSTPAAGWPGSVSDEMGLDPSGATQSDPPSQEDFAILLKASVFPQSPPALLEEGARTAQDWSQLHKGTQGSASLATSPGCPGFSLNSSDWPAVPRADLRAREAGWRLQDGGEQRLLGDIWKTSLVHLVVLCAS